MTRKLKEVLEEVTSYLREVPHIHQGGCLVAAYTVYNVLKKRELLPKKFVIVAVWPNWDNHSEAYKTNFDYLNGNSEKATSAYHFLYSFDGGTTTQDVDGISSEYDEWMKLIIPASRIEDFYYNAMQNGKWNQAFDRNKCIPAINVRFNINVWYDNFARIVNQIEDRRKCQETVSWWKKLINIVKNYITPPKKQATSDKPFNIQISRYGKFPG